MAWDRDRNKKPYRPPPPDPLVVRARLQRLARPCPRCRKPYTLMSSTCEECLPGLYSEKCESFEDRRGKYEHTNSFRTIFGIWKARPECISCVNLETNYSGKSPTNIDSYAISCKNNLQPLALARN